MNNSDPRTEPHVSGRELRDALTPRRRTRPSPLAAPEPSASPPAWEWSAGLSDRDASELRELRESAEAMREELAALRAAVDGARIREHETRAALSELAAAPVWRRRRVVNELTGRGLL